MIKNVCSLFLCAICFFGFIQKGSAQIDTMKVFAFGHSLIDHRPPLIPTLSDETTILHWLYLLADAAGEAIQGGGQYGFLPQHSNVPPISQWGYDIVPGVWESDTESFSDANINTILLTAGNFMQWQAPDLDYPSDPGISPISATEDIIDWVDLQGDNAKIYIYENWPDMAAYLANGFPPSESEFQNYHDFTLNDFHDWWITYQDALLISRPNMNVRMIPVGPILSKLFTEFIPNQISYTELYEDDAPHGRANLYFLSSMICYMAINEKLVPPGFQTGNIIDPVIQDNYQNIANYIWLELQKFNTSGGESRVFCSDLTNNISVWLNNQNIHIFPNPTQGQIHIAGITSSFTFEVVDATGQVFQTLDNSLNTVSIDISTLPNGLYFLRIANIQNNTMRIQKIIKSN